MSLVWLPRQVHDTGFLIACQEMPKTRTGEPREAKIEQLVAAAERRVRRGGYEALSVAALARELGLAQNAVYWYFPSKDHLFVAVLERMLRDIALRKSSRSSDPLQRVLWFTDQFAPLSKLQGAMEERARRSRIVADFVTSLDELLDRMLVNVFRDRVPDEQLPLAVQAFRVAAEGTFAKGLERRDRRRVLSFTFERLVGT
jgi:AcrR family transcriptional regulator